MSATRLASAPGRGRPARPGALGPGVQAALRPLVLVAISSALAGLSLLLPSAPGYDPWSWLIWAREVVALELSTAEGPAWKPLPVLVIAPFVAVSEGLAPEAWLAIARAGAILATLLAAVVSRRLGSGSTAAGVLAGGGLLLVPGWIENAAVGTTEGLLVALGLAAFGLALEGRLRAAFALLFLAALLRVEVWPFLAGLGLLLTRRERAAVVPVLLAGAAVLALWFVPELLGSGQLGRSAARAQVPNPGAPALAERPALATLATAIRLPPPVALAGLLGAAAAALAGARGARAALGLGAAGVAWISLVAAMSELGFSGEARYLLPGAALLTVAGTAAPFGLLAARRPGSGPVWLGGRVALTALVAAAVAATGVARADALGAGLDRVAYGARLADDLGRAVARGGGARALLRCGPPVVGPYRGPMVAWALGVHKAEVAFRPMRPGVSFRSRLGPASPVVPGPPPGRSRPVAATPLWRVEAACGRSGNGRADG